MALSALASEYISELLMLYTSARPLWSSEQGLLDVLRTRLKTRGDFAFAVLGLRLWNSVSLELRSANSLECFRAQLKISRFSKWFCA